MSRVRFNEGRHTYTLDGNRVPSVTGITGKVGDKGGLINAAVELTASYALNHAADLGVVDPDVWTTAVKAAYRRQWDAARDDGTMLHALAEILITGEPMPLAIGDKVIPTHVRDMAEQLTRFLDAHKVEPVLIEAVGFHELEQYAGKLDLVADIGPTRWLLDYKTSASGIWPETALQLCAYSRMTHYVDGDDDLSFAAVGVERCGAVWIRPDHWELIPTRADDAMFNVFRHAAAVADFAKLHRRESVGEPLPVPT